MPGNGTCSSQVVPEPSLQARCVCLTHDTRTVPRAAALSILLALQRLGRIGMESRMLVS